MVGMEYTLWHIEETLWGLATQLLAAEEEGRTLQAMDLRDKQVFWGRNICSL